MALNTLKSNNLASLGLKGLNFVMRQKIANTRRYSFRGKPFSLGVTFH